MGIGPFPWTESHADRISQAYLARLLIGPGYAVSYRYANSENHEKPTEKRFYLSGLISPHRDAPAPTLRSFERSPSPGRKETRM